MILSAPSSPGIYKMYDSAGELLYVGKARNLSKRLKQYIDIEKLEYHKIIMRRKVSKVVWQTTNTESDALVLEQDLIKTLHPKYNIILKDDKMYPYLGLSKDRFPRLYKFREKIKKAKNVWGPFPFVSDLNETIKLVQQVSKIRTCTNNSFAMHSKKPCLLFQMGFCSGPCVIKEQNNREQIDSYKKQVKLAKKILDGNTKTIVSNLTKEMKSAAKSKDFERALKKKKQIVSLQSTVKIASMSKRRTKSVTLGG